MTAFEHRLFSADVKPKGYAAVLDETFATDPKHGPTIGDIYEGSGW